MFLSSLISYLFPSSVSRSASPSVDLPPFEPRDLERVHDPASRRAHQFLKLIHLSDALVPKKQYSDSRDRVFFLSQLVVSVYILGASAEYITKLCDAHQGARQQWESTPAEVTKADWRDFLGNPAYQRGFVDFFEDDLSKHGYDWQAVLRKYLYDQETPFIHQTMSGGFEPLHHLAMAYRLQNRQLAIDGLTLAAIFYNKDQSINILTEQPTFDNLSNPGSTATLNEILERVSRETPRDSLSASRCKKYADTWDLGVSSDSPNLNPQLREAQRTATALLVASVPRGHQGKHDISFSQILVATQSLRVILPFVPSEHHAGLLRQWLLSALIEYIAAGRPALDFETIDTYPTSNRDWSWVERNTLDGKWRTNVFYVQAIATLKDASMDWRNGSGDLDDSEWFLKSALKFMDEFGGWRT